MRNLVLGIGLALLALCLGWVATRGDGEDRVEALQAIPTDRGGPAAPSSQPPAGLKGNTDQGRSSAVLPDPARLEVRVVDREGGPLDGVHVSLQLGEDLLEAQGNRHTFEDLKPGHGVLTVRHPGFPIWVHEVSLDPGEMAREVVQLKTEITLSGRVVDRFGAPRTGVQLWFLRAGQRHPMNAEATRDLVSGITDRKGQVRLTLPDAGAWRLSMGRVGTIDLTDGPRRIQHGGPNHFEIVLAGTTNLLVQVEPHTGSKPLTVIVMGRREDSQRARSVEEPIIQDFEVTDPVRQKRLDEARARNKSQGTPPQEAGIQNEWSTRYGRPADGPGVSEWVNRQSKRVGPSGQASFTELPPGEEFRIAITRRGPSSTRYESSSSLYLNADQRAVAKVRLPAQDLPSAEVVRPLQLSWKSSPLPPGEGAAGITWRSL